MRIIRTNTRLLFDGRELETLLEAFNVLNKVANHPDFPNNDEDYLEIEDEIVMTVREFNDLCIYLDSITENYARTLDN